MKVTWLIGSLFMSQLVFSQQNTQSQQILQKLSTEEKVKVVVGAGMNISFSNNGTPVVGKTEEKVPGAAGTSFINEKAGLPQIVFADGPAGLRISPKRDKEPGKTFYATGFPVATLMASTFNTELMENTGKAYGNECKEYGVDILLAPALNIHRNPLGGRNFEYYSEDPLLSGKMAAAFTRGIQSEGIGVSIKHFAANNQETNRAQVNTIVSERALREIYLKGFEIAVKESNPWTVMSSYNKINDVYTSESYPLLTTILRDEWGFNGFVMTDWFGGKNPVEQMKAGNDLLMPGSPQQEQTILEAINNGSLSMAELDRNVLRILDIYQQTISMKKYQPSNKPDLEQHKTVARQAATEGMVLLKNEGNTLPLDQQNCKAGLFGIGSYITIAGGTGSGDVNKAYVISIVDGLKNAGVKLDPEIDNTFTNYIKEQKAAQKPKQYFFLPDSPIEEPVLSDDKITELAKNTSAGIFTITRTSGEFFDRKLDDDFNLKASEAEWIKKLSAIYHQQNKPLVVLLNIGGVVETQSWKNLADAILVVWQPGQEAGNAVADILTGKVNPSGKLPMTFPVQYSDVYASKNFPGKELETDQPKNVMFGSPAEVVYEEGIYVGYRYFSSFQITPSYPFGYGLSYTTFKSSNTAVKQLTDGNYEVKCTITNTGKIAGKEVVQIYISAPNGKLNKPAKELKAFAKTNLLKPGEKQELAFKLTPYQLSSFDTETSSWVLEKGDYKVQVGKNVNEAETIGTITISENQVTLKANKALTPTRLINELK